MLLTSDHTFPGDDGYEYPDDGDDYDDPDPLDMCHLDGYGECVNRGQCMYFGCYYQGMWKWPRNDKDAPDPEF